MSVDINWSLLSTPAAGPSEGFSSTGKDADGSSKPSSNESHPNPSHPSAETLANHLITVLNTHLASTKRPSFIGPIEITSFNFGSTAPEVEIKDIRDVWRAFDEEDEDDEDDDDGGENGYAQENGYESRRVSGRSSADAYAYGYGHGHGHGNPYEQLSPLDMGSTTRLPSMLDWDDTASVFSSNRRQSLHAVGLGASRGLSPGPGGGPGLTSHAYGYGHGYGAHGHGHGHGFVGGFGGAGSVFSHPLSPGPTSTRHPAPTHTYVSHPPSPARPPTAKPPPSTSSSIPSLQLHLNLSHTSDLTLTLLTSLIVNYPSATFMSLPLKLSITGLQLAADIVVAFDGDKRRIHLTVLDDDTDGTSHQGHTHGHANGRQSVPVGQRLLPEMRIDSEIGHSDAHVLRNVGKVERFIADVVRKTLVDELVFPNFHTIAL